jgi:hypothetical protein
VGEAVGSWVAVGAAVLAGGVGKTAATGGTLVVGAAGVVGTGCVLASWIAAAVAGEGWSMLSVVTLADTVLADGADATAGVVVESVLAVVGFEGFCAVEEFSDAECAKVALAAAVTGSAAELTSVWTLVKLPEGAGKTTAAASESSFCRASESLAGAGVEVRGVAVPAEVGAIFLGELERRIGEMAGVAGRAAARIEGSIEVSGAVGVVGIDGWFVVDAGNGGLGGAGEFAANAIGSGFAIGADGCGLGAGKFAAAIRVVPGELAGAALGNAEGIEVVEMVSVVCGFSGAEGAEAATEYPGSEDEAGGCKSSVRDAGKADGGRLDAVSVGVWISDVWTGGGWGIGVWRLGMSLLGAGIADWEMAVWEFAVWRLETWTLDVRLDV